MSKVMNINDNMNMINCLIINDEITREQQARLRYLLMKAKKIDRVTFVDTCYYIFEP